MYFTLNTFPHCNDVIRKRASFRLADWFVLADTLDGSSWPAQGRGQRGHIRALGAGFRYFGYFQLALHYSITTVVVADDDPEITVISKLKGRGT